MARELYIPVNGFSKKTSKFYAPVNGFSKEIVKAYCSVNGFSKLFYEKGGGGKNVSIWDFFSTIAETIIEGNCNDIPNPIWVEVDKTNAGIAFYFIMPNYPVDQSAYYDPWHYVVTLSTDQSAVSYTYDGWDGTTRSCQVSSFTYNGETWYYGYATPLSFVTKPVYPNDYIPDCLMDYYYDAGTGIVDNIMPMIYSDDFAEDYQARQTYNAVFGDVEKTVRKALAIWLYKNYNFKGYAAYDTLLANLDTIIDRLLSDISNDNKVQVEVTDVIMTSSSTRIAVRIYSTDSSLDTFSPYAKYEVGGYTYLSASRYMYLTRSTYALIEGTGIRYNTDLSRSNLTTVGVRIIAPSQYRVDYGVILSNLGLDL